MTKDEYTKRLEEILKTAGVSAEPVIFGGEPNPSEREACINAILQLNNEAIPPKEADYLGQSKYWVSGYNQAIDELRAVIGASND